jgi:DNA-binding CsgD family transcriptional regulator
MTALRPEARELLGLTTREFEVLQLVALGRSNRQIGDELGIKEDTVAKHLYHVYRKLRVSSRTQALHRAAELTGEP